MTEEVGGRKKKRKVLLIIEDTGEHEGDGFRFYMGGDKERLNGTLTAEELGPAEFWGSALFNVCVQTLNAAGALNPGSKGEH